MIKRYLTTSNLSTLFLIAYTFWIWSPVLDFGFLRAYEPLWLMSMLDGFSLIDLYQSHSYFYYLDYLIFGWDARGWYFTGIVTHTLGGLAFASVVKLILVEFKWKGNITEFVFLFSLIFLGSYVYLDVLSWGSFNSYYGFLLFLISCTVLLYFNYQATKDKRILVASCGSFLIALLIRETAVLALILILTIIYLRQWEGLRETCRREKRWTMVAMAPYVGILIIFFIFRHFVGGVIGDMNDENVRGRLNLIANHDYWELIKRILLTFFKNAATLVFPFDWLNDKRAYFMSAYGYKYLMLHYAFPAVGLFAFLGLSLAALFGMRRGSPEGKLLALSLIIITVSLLIVAVAVPSIPAVHTTEYNLFTRRYNYFAFLGVALVITLTMMYFSALIAQNTLIAKITLVMVVIIFLVWNYHKVNKNLSLVYKTEHEKYLTFVVDFKKISPEFNGDKLVYYPHSSPDINDFLLALSLTKSSIYKGVKDGNGTNGIIVETQLDRVFKKLHAETAQIENTLFLKYSQSKGLENIADEILQNFSQKISYPLLIDQRNELSQLPNANSFFAEIPFSLKLEVPALDSSNEFTPRFGDFIEWYRTLRAEAGPTLGQRDYEPFITCDPKNVIDLNNNDGFGWCADGYVSWLELISNTKTDIYGVWFMTPSREVTPNQYSIFYDYTSNNLYCAKPQYKKIDHSVSIMPWGVFLSFKTPVKADAIKLAINNTYGNYANISEFNIVTKSMMNSLNKSSNIPKILNEIKKDNHPKLYWARIDWILSDGKTDIPMHKDILVRMSDKQQFLDFPFTGSTLRNIPQEGYLKYTYKSIRLTLPKEASRTGVKLYFTSTY
jgi:hypothetical protein